MSRISKKAADNEKLELLRKKLGVCGSTEMLRLVANRLFQRAPVLIQEIEEELVDVAKSKQKAALQEAILEKIQELVEPRNKDDTIELSMPTKLSAYISYVELLVVAVRSQSRQWCVYLLRDSPTEAGQGDLCEQGYNIRAQIKTRLRAMSLLPDVQVEAREDRIWLRIALVKLTKNRSKDKSKLEAARPAYLVYFPGEPYFYGVPSLREDIGTALAGCLGCGGWEALPLEGKHVDGLRRMRLGRDARDGPVKAKQSRDRFGMVGGAAEAPRPQPLIEKGTWSRVDEFQGGDHLRQSNLMEEGTMVKMSMVVAGKDIVAGLQNLVNEGVLIQPTPQWLTNFATAGRNKVRAVLILRRKLSLKSFNRLSFQFTLGGEEGRAVAAEREDWERFSHISTRSRARNNQ